MNLKQVVDEKINTISSWTNAFTIKQKLIYFIGCLVILTILFVIIKNINDDKVKRAVKSKALVLEFSKILSNKQISAKSFLKYYNDVFVEELENFYKEDKKALNSLEKNSPLKFKNQIVKISSLNDSCNILLKTLTENGVIKRNSANEMKRAFDKADNAMRNIVGAIESKEADLMMEGLTLSGIELNFQSIARDGLILFLKLRKAQFEFLSSGNQKARKEFELESSQASNRVSAILGFAKNLDDDLYTLESENYKVGINEYVKTAKLTFPLVDKENEIIQKLDSTISQIVLLVDNLNNQSEQAESGAEIAAGTTMIILSIIMLLIVLLFSLIMIQAITKPVNNLISYMDKIGDGDLSIDIDISGKDEISMIKVKLKETVDHLRETISAILDSADILTSSSEELKNVSTDLSSGANEMNIQAQSAVKMAEIGNNSMQKRFHLLPER